tara:strand:+ start:131 stop:661 length:531 start_codon:yes stop_codon:yes gene_type:complete
MSWKDILKKPLSERELAEVREFAQPKDMKTPTQKYEEYYDYLRTKQKDFNQSHQWTTDHIDYLFAGAGNNISWEQSIHLLEETVDKFGLELEPILEYAWRGEESESKESLSEKDKKLIAAQEHKHPFWDWATNRVKQLEVERQSSDKSKLEILRAKARESQDISDVAARKRRRAEY